MLGDVWSLGLILSLMLGCFDQPLYQSHVQNWEAQSRTFSDSSPEVKQIPIDLSNTLGISKHAKNLLERMLSQDLSRRASIFDIKRHVWFKKAPSIPLMKDRVKKA